MVHWQAGDRPLPAQRVTVSGESALWVDPAEIPSDSDIGKLGLALAAGRHGERDELMASTAAYSGVMADRLWVGEGPLDGMPSALAVPGSAVHPVRWERIGR